MAGNIKHYSKNFYAYVRSKQKVRDKVGPLENNSGNIISEEFQMAANLNEYFSSVFTTEDISSLPVPLTKFEGNTSEHLGQLFVTPEMIAKEIKKMKDNKSPGVDGIPPKLLQEIVEQISTPLAKVFKLSLSSAPKWASRGKGPTLRKSVGRTPFQCVQSRQNEIAHSTKYRLLLCIPHLWLHTLNIFENMEFVRHVNYFTKSA